MMVERINDFVARLGRGVGTTAGSFARIGLWTVLFLVLISLVLPSRELVGGQITAPEGHDNLRLSLVDRRPNVEPYGIREIRPNDPVQNVRLSFDDQRSFAKSSNGPDRFRIAWIAGSETGVFGKGSREYIASSVVAGVPEIGGRKTAVDVYFLPSIRTGDIYFALLDALTTKPDMIVISLTPMYVLNPLAVHEWMQLDSNAARELLERPASWPIAASFLSPSDLMWGIGSDSLDPVRDRWYYGSKVHGFFDDFGPLDRSDLTAINARRVPDRYQAALDAQPANFFLAHRVGAANFGTASFWAQWLSTGNRGEGPLNKMLLRAIARELRESKIPSYVYLAQANSDFLENSSFDRELRGIEGQLSDLRQEFRARSIIYQPQSISRFVAPTEFLPRDAVHLRTASVVGPYLAGEVCRLARRVGEQVTCR